MWTFLLITLKTFLKELLNILVLSDYAVSTDHKVKLKESEKKDKCRDIVR